MLPVVEVATGENLAGSKFSFSADKSTATSPSSFGQASSLDSRPETINRKQISVHFLDNKQTPHLVIFALVFSCCSQRGGVKPPCLPTAINAPVALPVLLSAR